MSVVVKHVDIDASPAEVFEYVTTPATWPAWHPSSLRVDGATDHPLALGESVFEDYNVAGRVGRVLWTVRNCDRPKAWSIVGSNEFGDVVTISYSFREDPGGRTNFRRELAFLDPDPLNWNRLQLAVEAETEEALRRLKAAVESRKTEIPASK